MGRTSAEWQAIGLAEQSLTMLLGWRPRARRLEAQRVEVGPDVADELRLLCRETLDRLGGLTSKPYEDTAILEPDEEFFQLTLGQLAQTSNGAQPATGADEAAEIADLLTIVRNPGSKEQMLPGQVRDGTFLFYAVICQDRQGQPIAFVKQQQSIRVARTGRLLTTFGDRLTKVTNPVFAFGHDFDLVLTSDELAILRTDAYWRLFTDVDVLGDAVPGFVTNIDKRVAVELPAEIRDLIEVTCKAKPSLAKRVQKLSRREWLEQITPESLANAMAKYTDLPEGVKIVDGAIEVTEAGVPILLTLFEQVAWVGDFDQVLRTAQAYSTVPHRSSPGT